MSLEEADANCAEGKIRENCAYISAKAGVFSFLWQVCKLMYMDLDLKYEKQKLVF